jgi:ribonuclease J
MDPGEKEFEIATVFFTDGDPTRGNFRLVGKYKGLVVGLCSRPKCPHCERNFEAPGFYRVKLEYSERSDTKEGFRAFYIAHDPEAMPTSAEPPRDMDEAVARALFTHSNNHGLKVTPLGHMDRIGASCFAYEWDSEILIVDFGIDVGGLVVDDRKEGDNGLNPEALPFLRFIAENLNRISGIFITHGHHDHIGGLPYLSNTVLGRVPIYATRLARRLIERIFKRTNPQALDAALIREFVPDEKVQIGKFSLETFRVAHSIPEACGFSLTVNDKRCVHLGDFKFNGVDDKPKIVLTETLQRIGQTPVDLLVIDTLNAKEPEFTAEENLAFQSLWDVISRSTGRVIVSLFATNFERIKRVLEFAQRIGRFPVFLGSAMQDCAEIGVKEYGFPADFTGKEAIYLVTGCQAEEGSVLRSASEGIDSNLVIGENDAIVISARPIPGNEERFKKMVLGLVKFGARVFVDKKGYFPEFSGKRVYAADLHVSGHGSAEDLKLVLQTLQPRKVLPFHGSRAALLAFKNLASQLLPATSVLLIFQNQEVLI